MCISLCTYQQILKNKISNALTDAVCAYAERKYYNSLVVRSIGERFEEQIQQDVSEFFHGSNVDVFRNQ